MSIYHLDQSEVSSEDLALIFLYIPGSRSGGAQGIQVSISPTLIFYLEYLALILLCVSGAGPVMVGHSTP